MSKKPSMASVVEVFDDIPVLLPAGCGRGHDALDKSTARLALCSEADLAPQNALPELPLGKIVRRLDAFVIDEGPHVLLFFQEAFAHTGHRAFSADFSLDEEVACLDSQICHSTPKGGPAQCPVPDLVPPVEHQVSIVHQLLAYSPGLALHFREALKPAQQMGPAKLSQAGVDTVWRPPVRTQDPAEASQQLPSRFPAPTEVDHEHRHGRGDGYPQPGLLVALSPAGLVGIQHPGFLCVLSGLFDWFLDCLADALLAGRDRTEADLEPDDIRHKILDEALALMVDTGQQRRQSDPLCGHGS